MQLRLSAAAASSGPPTHDTFCPAAATCNSRCLHCATNMRAQQRLRTSVQCAANCGIWRDHSRPRSSCGYGCRRVTTTGGAAAKCLLRMAFRLWQRGPSHGTCNKWHLHVGHSSAHAQQERVGAVVTTGFGPTHRLRHCCCSRWPWLHCAASNTALMLWRRRRRRCVGRAAARCCTAGAAAGACIAVADTTHDL